MEKWKDEAEDLKFEQNKSWTEIAKIIKEKYFVELDLSQVRDKVRTVLRRSEKYKNNQFREVRKKINALELAHCSLNSSDNVQDLKSEKQELLKQLYTSENKHTENWNGEQIIKFGVVSDCHLCSKYQQLTFLNHLYDIFVQEGITTVYNPGDLTEGYKMRIGHEFEIFKLGADEQAQYVIDVYPKREGIITKYITGNHDHSHIKNGGIDIGKIIASKRADMIYLGMANAKVYITDNCIVELNHPLDGASYALSYAPQKTIDAMSGGTKPNILLNGHHHKIFYMQYRNIHAYECGTTQAQTPWMLGKRIAANVGGLIVEVHVDEQGTITRCKGEFIPQYISLKDDY